jgi:hypothetical protein
MTNSREDWPSTAKGEGKPILARLSYLPPRKRSSSITLHELSDNIIKESPEASQVYMATCFCVAFECG